MGFVTPIRIASLGLALGLCGAGMSARAADSMSGGIAAQLSQAALNDPWAYGFLESLTTEVGQRPADDTLDKVDPKPLAQAVGAWAAFAYLAADSDANFRALAAAAPS